MTDCPGLGAGCGLGQDWSGATGLPGNGGGSAAVPAWQNWIGDAFKTVENILTAKTQTKGVLTQTSPGVFTYVQPEGSKVTLPVNVSPAGTLGVSAVTTPGMGLVLVGGAVLVLVLVMAKRK